MLKQCTLFAIIFWSNFARLNMCCAPLNAAHCTVHTLREVGWLSLNINLYKDRTPPTPPSVHTGSGGIRVKLTCVRFLCELWMVVGVDEVDMVGQPAHHKDADHHAKHHHHLKQRTVSRDFRSLFLMNRLQQFNTLFCFCLQWSLMLWSW